MVNLQRSFEMVFIIILEIFIKSTTAFKNLASLQERRRLESHQKAERLFILWYKFGHHEMHGETKKYMIGKIRRLVLDVLKPMEPNIIEMAEIISRKDGVSAVNISMVEIDLKVENAKITIEGDNILYEEIRDQIEDMGGSIHSIDEVVAGKMIIDDAATLQD